jgi:hypothetical protein
MVYGVMGDRLEVIVERWTNQDKSTAYRWSIWRGGTRVQMGGPHPSAEASERDAVEFCRKNFQRAPDRIERL